uniref:alpha-amylase n=1 Tax=Denticeps clupeoides TaxID=299321 RepID=A0AAY4ALB3_9TELE
MKLLVLAALLGLSLAQHNPHTKEGRTSIVHLFEWRWEDIAAECERYLAPNGYGGVQISPPSESIVISDPWRPWWQRYQPISYNLCSRSGNEQQLKDMITRCNNVGVNIYVDVVINHMCGSGGGAGTHSSCGTYFNANSKEFPSVPYSGLDFNDGKCKTGSGNIENYNDIYQACLNTAFHGRGPHFKQKVHELREKHLYLFHSGFTFVSAGERLSSRQPAGPGFGEGLCPRQNGRLPEQARRHGRGWIQGGCLQAHVARGPAGRVRQAAQPQHPVVLRWLAAVHLPRGAVFPRFRQRRVVFRVAMTCMTSLFQVIDLGGEPITSGEYTGLGRVTEFKYGAKLGEVMRRWNGQKLSYLKNWGEGWSFMPSDKALVFVDNHDNQRGHGAGGASILTFWDARLYKMGVGLMLAHPYGVTRVMSSFRWDRNIVNGQDKNDWIGPPSYSDGSTKPVPINPDSTCGDGWVCEHRWRQIRNMAIFRNVVNGQPFANWWDNGSNQIAFGRGDRGFIVINNDEYNLDATLNTGLPGGTYCDVISGDKDGGRCTGKQVQVGGDGRAHFSISNSAEDPFMAIHADSKL